MGKDILFVVPSIAFGGTEIHTLDLARQYRRVGHRVQIAFPVNTSTASFFDACVEQDLQVVNLPISPRTQPPTLEDFANQEDALRSYLTSSAGATHTHVVVASPSPKSALGLLSAATGLSCKFICVFHFPSMNLRTSVLDRRLLASASNDVRLVCISEHTRNEIATAFRLDPAIFQVIPNGTELEVNVDSSRSVLRELGREGALLITTVGRLHRQKGYDVLVEAVPEIIALVPDVHFVWCGDGPEEEALMQRVRELDVYSHVSFVGHVEDPERYLAQSDLVVLPTRGEGLSLTLLQSLALGCAVVTTDAAMQGSILDHGKNGIIVPVEDAHALAVEIVALLENSTKRAELREGAKSLSISYNIEDMRSAYIKLLDDCAPIQSIHQQSDLGNDGAPSWDALSECVRALDVTSNPDQNGQSLIKWLDTKAAAASDADLLQVLRACTNFLPNEEMRNRLFRFIAAMLDEPKSIRRSRVMKWVEDPMLATALRGKLYMVIELLEAHLHRTSDAEVKRVLFELYQITGRPEAALPFALEHSSLSLVRPSPNSRKRVAIVAPYFSYPPRNGSHNRMLQMIKGYCDLGHQVGIFAWPMPQGPELRPVDVGKLRADLGVEVHLHRLSASSTASLNSYQGGIKRGDLNNLTNFDQEIALSLRKFLEYFQPNVLHLNYIYFGWMAEVADRERVTVVMDTHDIISRRSKLFSQISAICGKPPVETKQVDEKVFEISRFRASSAPEIVLEGRRCETFDHTICISAFEEDLLRGSGCSANLTTIPFIPEYRELPSPTAARTCLFVGSRNPLNVIGLAALENHVVPRLRALVPDVHFEVAGDVGLAAGPNPPFDVLGFVDNLEDAYLRNSITVCPLPLGTGQNIKITESLSYGRPVVAFAGVAESSGVQHMVNGMIATSLDEFYHQVRHLMQDDLAREVLSRSTRDWAINALKADKVASKLNGILT